MGGSGTLVEGIRRWFQRRTNHNNHDHINNINKTTSSNVSSSGCPQSSVNVKEGIKGTEEEQLTVIEDFDISDLKLIRVPKRFHFPPGSTMGLQKKGSAEADFFTEYGEASQYQVQEVIGKGSYGVVGSAIDSHTGERVAIKKINDVFEHVSDATRILREIKLLRLLRHPDIVEIKHIMLPPSRREFKDIYVVFELMESDLHQVIKANDDLTPEHYQFFLYQLLRGLKYIHTANVFHRDLKPKNILANADCKLKICDFGLARVSFNDAPSAILWTDYVATRWYRAPELCGSFFSKYTPAIDIWSIGCIFAEMLTGKPLFPGKNVVHQLDLMTDLLGTPPPESISKIRNEKARRYLSNMRKKPPVPFPQKFPNVDPLALRLLEALLAFDPKDRPTAEEALANPYFNGLSNVECEPSTQPISKLEFEFERRKITKDDVRELIYREILEYHPQMLKEYLRGGEQTSFMYPSGVDRFKRQFAHLEEHYGKGERSTPLQRQHASLPRERVPAPKDETAAQSTDIERQTAPSIAKSLKSLPGSQQADGSEDLTVAAQNGSSKPNYSNRSLLKSSSISASKCVVVKPKGDSEIFPRHWHEMIGDKLQVEEGLRDPAKAEGCNLVEIQVAESGNLPVFQHSVDSGHFTMIYTEDQCDLIGKGFLVRRRRGPMISVICSYNVIDIIVTHLSYLEEMKHVKEAGLATDWFTGILPSVVYGVEISTSQAKVPRRETACMQRLLKVASSGKHSKVSQPPSTPCHASLLLQYNHQMLYHTTNEGFHHATKFRSIVLFYGTTYASRLTFSHRKEAEPDVEKFALECIKEKLKVEDSSHYLQGCESRSGVLCQIINSKVKLCRANVKAPSCEQNNSSEVWKAGNLLLLLEASETASCLKLMSFYLVFQ
ncbi:hypothetical protein H0E87_026083 [Populus deltoides]|uniref:mitogen-activated protein kinase n=1 Tax=Populus deltoides TaxID=3696 RepID=A0A8T2X1H6_POPDE|nr:hypothetical protein H0E87_026083 [Populus deltoides]